MRLPAPLACGGPTASTEKAVAQTGNLHKPVCICTAMVRVPFAVLFSQLVRMRKSARLREIEKVQGLRRVCDLAPVRYHLSVNVALNYARDARVAVPLGVDDDPGIVGGHLRLLAKHESQKD